jgi:hypothetical protein
LYDVDATCVSGRWWRHIPAGGDVFYEPPDPADNRWQRGHVVDAWYFADEEPTVWAEWYRAVAELGVPPAAARPGSRVLCVFRSSREVPGTDPIPPPRSIADPPLVPPGMTT